MLQSPLTLQLHQCLYCYRRHWEQLTRRYITSYGCGEPIGYTWPGPLC